MRTHTFMWDPDTQTVTGASPDGWELAQANPQATESSPAAAAKAQDLHARMQAAFAEAFRLRAELADVFTAPDPPVGLANARAEEADLNQAVGIPSSTVAETAPRT